MKKILLFCILILPLVSCKKEANTPVIAGDWDVTFTTTATGGTKNHGVFSITQDGNALSGTLTTGGKVIQFFSNSAITSYVAIYCDTYLFQGTLSGNDTMSGDLYVFDIFTGVYSKDGTWEGTRK